ncbi:hypothetical protein RclHR1_21610001 [Rhizophagus clarus]|uniref:Uncharacterized protein n=1 Tax=Rhizophagus clarus TaxID=94130 RepID=A0A2Z6QTQ9_9GLOM|nr:hypothetical protein RclHR1_21610001 [Rhizophagus clarus]
MSNLKPTKRKYNTRSASTNKNIKLKEDNEILKKINVKGFKEKTKSSQALDEDYEVVMKGSSAIMPKALENKRRRDIENSVAKDITTYGKKKNCHTNSYSKKTTSSVELSRPTTPIDDEEHSRLTTPIDFVTSSVDIEHSELFTLTTSEQQHHETNSIYEKWENQLKDMLIKQGKQVRALYELHKLMNEKLSWIQSQIKKQTKSRDDLNPKEGYNAVYTQYFSEKMWPNFDEFKCGLENWLKKNHSSYLKEIGEQEWVNQFCSKHHALLLKKIKDIRGVHTAAVCSAIFKEFSVQLPSYSKKNLKKLYEWKKSDEIRECYNKLYDENDNVMESIARCAFSNILNDNESFDAIYIWGLCNRKKSYKTNGSIELSDSLKIVREETPELAVMKNKEIIEEDLEGDDEKNYDKKYEDLFYDQ